MKKIQNWGLRSLLFLFFGLIGVLDASAQHSIRDSSIKLWMFDVGYGGYFPAGDFAKRFGYTSQIGLQVGYKFKSNYYFSLGATFLFGDQIRENKIFADLGHNNVWNTTTGEIVVDQGWIDKNGQVILPSLFQRGFTIPFRVGKIFPAVSFKGTNKNTGLFVETGLQFIQHQITITAPPETPYLTGDYEKGYDRLTRGIGAIGSVGYRFFSSKRYINFFFALDYQHNFTRNTRFNFDLGHQDTRVKNDILYGFRFGWCLPIYREAPDKFYYD